MSENELMLGNYLYNDGVVVKIDARSIFDIWDNKGLKNYNPIPLTQKWMLDFGYSVISESSAGYKYGFVINHILSSDLIFVLWKTTKDAGKIFRGDLQLKYVHQLQNLHFALTTNLLQLVDPKYPPTSRGLAQGKIAKPKH